MPERRLGSKKRVAAEIREQELDSAFNSTVEELFWSINNSLVSKPHIPRIPQKLGIDGTFPLANATIEQEEKVVKIGLGIKVDDPLLVGIVDATARLFRIKSDALEPQMPNGFNAVATLEILDRSHPNKMISGVYFVAKPGRIFNNDKFQYSVWTSDGGIFVPGWNVPVSPLGSTNGASDHDWKNGLLELTEARKIVEAWKSADSRPKNVLRLANSIF